MLKTALTISEQEPHWKAWNVVSQGGRNGALEASAAEGACMQLLGVAFGCSKHDLAVNVVNVTRVIKCAA